jgi:hypothetical protein
MRWFRFSLLLLLPILAGSVLLLTGAIAQQATPPPKAASPAAPPPSKPDAQGSKSLDKAIEMLDPGKVGWLETALWQEMQVQGLRFTVTGHFISGPGHRMRLDMKVDLGTSSSELSAVSDGTTVWDSLRLSEREKTVAKWDLKTVEQLLTAPGTVPQIAEGFYSSRSFFGIWPLLQNLRKQMKVTKQEDLRWQNRDVYKLTAEWTPEISKNLTIQDRGWQPGIPRLCHLFLNKQSYWPERLEWWGPARLGGADVLLLQMEFRDPQITKSGAEPPERYKQAFVFVPPKGVTVKDMTKQVTDQIALQVRSQPAPSGAPRQ